KEASKLMLDLQKNERVSLDLINHNIAYKPVFPDITDNIQLLKHIEKYEYGISEQALLDAYNGVEKDIQHYVEEGDIYKIYNDEKKKDLSQLFFRHKGLEIQIEPELKRLWHSIRMPSSQIELEETLLQSGHM